MNDMKLNLIINNDKIENIDASNNLKFYLLNLMNEVNQKNKPLVLHIDFINTTSIHATRLNRVFEADLPIYPIEGASNDNLSETEKNNIDIELNSRTNKILNYITNELALCFVEAKTHGDIKTFEFIENLSIMKDYDLHKFKSFEHDLDKHYKLHQYTETQIEKGKLKAIEDYLKRNQNILNDTSLHVIKFNGKKYLFGLKRKDEISNSAEENNKIIDALRKIGTPQEDIMKMIDANHEQEIYFKATEPNYTALIDIAKGMFNLEYKDNLKKSVENILALDNKKMRGEE